MEEKMGNTIIRASHVGMTIAYGRGYPGPASDEEMAIAKRAAKRTLRRWAAMKAKTHA